MYIYTCIHKRLAEAALPWVGLPPETHVCVIPQHIPAARPKMRRGKASDARLQAQLSQYQQEQEEKRLAKAGDAHIDVSQLFVPIPPFFVVLKGDHRETHLF